MKKPQKNHNQTQTKNPPEIQTKQSWAIIWVGFELWACYCLRRYLDSFPP